MKIWLKENEPYLRLIEITFIVVVGGFVSYIQFEISSKQAAVAEQALKVSEAELKLIDLQRMDHQPYFTFDHTGAVPNFSPSSFYIRNKSGAEVRSLKGFAKLFLLVKSPKGEKRILIDNFYDPNFISPEDGSICFTNVTRLIYPDFFGIPVNDYSNDHLLGHARNPVQFPMPFTICNYVELHYVTEDHRDVIRRFEMKFPCQSVTPIPKSPDFDRVIDISPYRKGEHTYDFDALHRSLVEVVEEVSGGNVANLETGKSR